MISPNDDNVALQFLLGPWFALFASILVMDTTGGSYMFGMYSEAIRSSLGYDQKMLNMVGFFKNLGGSLGILPGLAINGAMTLPPWVVLVCGAGLNLAGYVMIYLAIVRRKPSAWRMCVYMAIGAVSQSFASTGAVVSAVHNFSEADRGGLLGMLTGFAGLSASMFAQLHRSFAGIHGEDGTGIVMLIACIPTAISLLFSPVIRRIPRPNNKGEGGGEREATSSEFGFGKRPRERKALRYLVYASVAVGVFLLTVNVVELKAPDFPKPAYYITAIVLLLLKVSLPFAVVLHPEVSAFMTIPSSSTTTTTTKEESSLPPPQPRYRRSKSEDHTIVEALCSVEMILILVITLCGIGGLLTAIDNIAQIGESLGYAKGAVSILVSLLSLSNYAGRVVGGFGSEIMLTHYRVPRPVALTVALLLACVGHLIVAFGVRNGLYAASLLIGFSVGAQWPVVFAIVSEVFGLKNFGTLYNLVPLATPLGSYVLNVQVTGRLYDRETRRQQACWSRPTCIGVRCFKGSFLVITSVTLFGAVVSLMLVWKTKDNYTYKHLADDDPRSKDIPLTTFTHHGDPPEINILDDTTSY